MGHDTPPTDVVLVLVDADKEAKSARRDIFQFATVNLYVVVGLLV